MNRVVLIGRLVRDPEVRMTDSGKTVAKFTVAVDRPVAKGAEKETDFLKCVAFGKLAETIGNYLAKGRRAAFLGRIQIREYENKQGEKARATEIIVSDMEFLDSRAERSVSSEQQQSPLAGMGAAVPIFDEEVPF